MKMKKVLATVLCLAMLAPSIMLAVSAAYTNQSAYSDTSTFTNWKKEKYDAYTWIFFTPYPPDDPNPPYTDIQVSVQVNAKSYPSSDCPAGYMGASCELYRRDGYLIFDNYWAYNTGKGNALLSYHTTSYIGGAGESFYGKGQVALYNGNGEDLYTTKQTPTLTITYDQKQITTDSLDTMVTVKSGVNENNQSYGSGLTAQSADAEPDLIAAIGVDGAKGYVYAEELRSIGRRDSLNDVVALPNVVLIPLYAVDGTTVVGEFEISKPEFTEFMWDAAK